MTNETQTEKDFELKNGLRIHMVRKYPSLLWDVEIYQEGISVKQLGLDLTEEEAEKIVKEKRIDDLLFEQRGKD